MSDALEHTFQTALRENPADRATRLAYADWLAEHDRDYEAAIQRVKAGVSEARFTLRRKTDGLYADGFGGWSASGKAWKSLARVRSHLSKVNNDLWRRDDPLYFDQTPWDDLEVIFEELRDGKTTFEVALPVSRWGDRNVILVYEP